MGEVTTDGLRYPSSSDPLRVWEDIRELAEDTDAFVTGRTLFARKTADESVASSTTLQDDNDLTVSVEANRVYRIDAQLLARAPTAADIKGQWVVPSGATLDLYGDSQFDGTRRHINEGAVFTFPLESTTHPLSFTGLFVVGSTAGIFKLQWCQNTSDAGNTTLVQHSYLEMRKVA